SRGRDLRLEHLRGIWHEDERKPSPGAGLLHGRGTAASPGAGTSFATGLALGDEQYAASILAGGKRDRLVAYVAERPARCRGSTASWTRRVSGPAHSDDRKCA